eukprot:GHVS01063071.1.p1 GENE.GHVS01063071.1~~GHVS01063071.1.p1  ORF type:complete len:599 (+),score=70.45 GHVS01063071.1:257-1798(+)
MADFACGTAMWMHTGMMLGVWLTTLREQFESLARTGAPPPPRKVTPNPDGKTYKVLVGPSGWLMNILLTFGSLELYVEGPPDQSPRATSGGVALVLGAGNYDSPVDILSAMFIEGFVCIYKWSPLSQAIRPVVEAIFEPLVNRGFLRFVHVPDPADVHALLHHSHITKLFMTGSQQTAKKLLYGDKKELQMKKNFCFELGNCTAWVVVPPGEGRTWAGYEMHRHARQIVFSMLFNGGHVCTHVQLIITCKAWSQRAEFLQIIRHYLQAAPIVGCFYGDFTTRMSAAKKKMIAEGKNEDDFSITLPFPISQSDAADVSEQKTIFFADDLEKNTFLSQEEMFCPVAGEVALDTANNIPEFLAAAVDYANQSCAGTLAINISVKTNTKQDEEALEKAICALEYGSVGVNCYSLLCCGYPNVVWGGYPGATVDDLKSGIGFLGNCFGYSRPLKSVIRQPFINLTHYCLVLPSQRSAGRLSKTWRRLSSALLDRKPSQSTINALWQLTIISSGLAFNL